MRFRDGLIAARGQILWILLLAASSAAILHAELPARDAPVPVATP